MTHNLSLALICSFACLSLSAAHSAASAEEDPEGAGIALHQAMMLFASDSKRRKALRYIRRRDSTDMVAAMIISLRYLEPDARAEVVEVLQRVSDNHRIEDVWFDWMVWQQRHPEVQPFEDFVLLQVALYTKIDPDFGVFFDPLAPSVIRREEITWGGVVKDGIPALNHPAFTTADEADYLKAADPVFGVAINGDIRAYPYRIMDWHEMANDTVGGVPVALAYCTLCGSAILYRTDLEGFEAPLQFGSSGFLYRSNKLMYDQATHSLWNQFVGKPAVGSLVDRGLELPVLPLVTTSWGKWRRMHPDTLVLDPETGFSRSYKRSTPYRRYFRSADLMFPAAVDDERLDAKSQVFGLRVTGAEKAWPLSVFEGGRVINDRAGVLSLVVIGDAETKTVRAYRSDGRRFLKVGPAMDRVEADGALWSVEEDGLHGPDGEVFSRLPGHLAYWFAWGGRVGEGELFETGL